MRVPHTTAIIFALLFAVAAEPKKDVPPSDDEVAEKIKLLDLKNDLEVRRKAISWLLNSGPSPKKEMAFPALEKCFREERHMGTRGLALYTLGQLSEKLKKPCPQVVIDALLDKDEEVRMYGSMVYYFNPADPGAMDVPFRCLKSEYADARQSAVEALARYAPKDKKALEAIERAKLDGDFLVRLSANNSLFKVNNDLGEILRFFIKVREDAEAVTNLYEKDSNLWKRERAAKNLFLIGFASRIVGWSNDERSGDLARTLVKLLEDQSPTIRSGAASLIGAASQKIEYASEQDFRKDENHLLRPFLYPGVENKPDPKDPEPKQPLQKSKAGVHLESLKAQDLLRKLDEKDPDISVRTAARIA